jgi:hypothetical protein
LKSFEIDPNSCRPRPSSLMPMSTLTIDVLSNTRLPDRADNASRSDVKCQLQGGVLRALVESCG